MSDGFLFVGQTQSSELLRGRMPFRILQSDKLYFHFRMEYETKDFVKYDENNIKILPTLIAFLKKLESEELFFAFFRLEHRESAVDLPNKYPSFGKSSWNGEVVEINTLYTLF